MCIYFQIITILVKKSESRNNNQQQKRTFLLEDRSFATSKRGWGRWKNFQYLVRNRDKRLANSFGQVANKQTEGIILLSPFDIRNAINSIKPNPIEHFNHIQTQRVRRNFGRWKNYHYSSLNRLSQLRDSEKSNDLSRNAKRIAFLKPRYENDQKRNYGRWRNHGYLTRHSNGKRHFGFDDERKHTYSKENIRYKRNIGRWLNHNFRSKYNNHVRTGTHDKRNLGRWLNHNFASQYRIKGSDVQNNEDGATPAGGKSKTETEVSMNKTKPEKVSDNPILIDSVAS